MIEAVTPPYALFSKADGEHLSVGLVFLSPDKERAQALPIADIRLSTLSLLLNYYFSRQRRQQTIDCIDETRHSSLKRFVVVHVVLHTSLSHKDSL